MRRIDRGYRASRSGELGKDARRRNKEAKNRKRVDRPLYCDIRATASDGKARASAWGPVVELLERTRVRVQDDMGYRIARKLCLQAISTGWIAGFRFAAGGFAEAKRQ